MVNLTCPSSCTGRWSTGWKFPGRGSAEAAGRQATAPGWACRISPLTSPPPGWNYEKVHRCFPNHIAFPCAPGPLKALPRSSFLCHGEVKTTLSAYPFYRYQQHSSVMSLLSVSVHWLQLRVRVQPWTHSTSHTRKQQRAVLHSNAQPTLGIKRTIVKTKQQSQSTQCMVWLGTCIINNVF